MPPRRRDALAPSRAQKLSGVVRVLEAEFFLHLDAVVNGRLSVTGAQAMDFAWLEDYVCQMEATLNWWRGAHSSTAQSLESLNVYSRSDVRALAATLDGAVTSPAALRSLYVRLTWPFPMEIFPSSVMALLERLVASAQGAPPTKGDLSAQASC